MITDHVYFSFSYIVAKKYGVNGALILNRIIWSINYHAENPERWRDRYFRDGQWWMNDTYESIANHFGGILGSARSIRDTIKKFERDGLLSYRQYDNVQMDMTKWYCLNTKIYEQMFATVGTGDDKSSPQPTKSVTWDDKNGHIDESETVSSTNLSGLASSNLRADVPSTNNASRSSNLRADVPSPLNNLPNQSPNQSSKQSPTAPLALSRDLGSLITSLKGPEGIALPLEKKRTRKPRPKVERPEKPKCDADDLEIGKAWFEFALKEMPWKKPPKSWSEEAFALALARVRKATDLNFEGIKAVLAFVKRDNFWRDKALSPSGLLTTSENGNRKIDNLLLKMKSRQGYTADVIAEMAAGIRDDDIW